MSTDSLYIYALLYSIGRSGHVVVEVAQLIARDIGKLENDTLRYIMVELHAALGNETRHQGMELERQTWGVLKGICQIELSRRAMENPTWN